MPQRLLALTLPLILGTLLAVCGATPQARPESTGPIASSGGVEIESIHIERRKAADAAKGADLTNMTVGLWFTADTKGGPVVLVPGRHYLARLLALDPVVDDTGKVLSTKERLAAIGALQAEVSPSAFRMSRGKEGPFIKIVLEAPARGAAKIQSLTGKAEVAEVTHQMAKFEALSKLLGKPLEHPLLKEVQVQPKVEVAKDGTTVTLRVTGSRARIVTWAVVRDSQALRSTFGGVSPFAGGAELSQGFEGQLPKDCALWLTVAVPAEKKVYDFRFKDIELP